MSETISQITKPVIDSDQLSMLHLEGYKSIAECHLELSMLNVLIGANGAGKSNFIGFFKLIRKILDEQLQLTVSEQGGPDALLHYGRKKTEQMSVELRFGNNGYNFKLKPTQDNRMMFAYEALWWNGRAIGVLQLAILRAMQKIKKRVLIFMVMLSLPCVVGWFIIFTIPVHPPR